MKQEIFTAAVGASVLLAVAGCAAASPRSAPDKSTPTAPGTTKSSAPESPATAASAAALAAYRGMWQDFVIAGTTSDWQSAALGRDATGVALSTLSRGLYSDHYSGVVTKGGPVLHPTVAAATPAADPTSVTINDCGDSTNFLRYHADTGARVDDDPGGRQFIKATVQKQSDSSWKVTDFGIQAVGVVLTRVATVGALGAALLVLPVLPAFANGWGGVTCSEIPTPDCQLGVGTPGSPGTPGSGGSGGHGGGGATHSGGHGSSGPTGPGGDTVVGNAGLAHCSYVPSDYQPPSGAISTTYRTPTGPRIQPAVRLVALTHRAGSTPGQQGSWYVWQCDSPGDTDAVYHPPIWVAAGQPAPGGAPAPPSPAQVAQLALRQLRLPTPTIATNPAGEQLVNLPTWLWLASGWNTQSATATVPGVSVTATATPTTASWSTSDGSSTTCRSAGTPFRPGDNPKSSSPDCGHTYRTSSAGQPGQAYPVTVTVHWTVTWAGAGQTGTFPDLTTTATANVRVAESQALNTG